MGRNELGRGRVDWVRLDKGIIQLGTRVSTAMSTYVRVS
jgi:hypothetical protein